ncbi:MAG: hypothetical protein L0K86_09360 [Actinomycetia bacterium]|nr:hypothetical protein [Actinomycetes bacterium]
MRKLGVTAALLALLAASSCFAGADQPAPGTPGSNLPGTREFGLSDQDYVEHVDRTQTLIASCMKRAGFEYVPVDVATIERAQASVRQEPGMSRRQYKEKWGLSVTTRFDDPVRTIGLGPNVAIIDGFGPADRVAYELTLFGEGRDSDFAFTLDEEDFSATGGCTREAVSQVFAPEQLTGTYVNPKDALVAQDPRITAAEDAWTSCMQAAGYNYKGDQGVIIEDFQQRLDALAKKDDPETLTGERLEALRALQAEEIKVSLADLDCQVKYTDEVYRVVETEVFGRPVS